jgi:hypothetical protein
MCAILCVLGLARVLVVDFDRQRSRENAKEELMLDKNVLFTNAALAPVTITLCFDIQTSSCQNSINMSHKFIISVTLCSFIYTSH